MLDGNVFEVEEPCEVLFLLFLHEQLVKLHQLPSGGMADVFHSMISKKIVKAVVGLLETEDLFRLFVPTLMFLGGSLFGLVRAPVGRVFVRHVRGNMIDKNPCDKHILAMLTEKLQQIREDGLKSLQSVKTTDDLQQFKVHFFGKQGHLTLLMKEMSGLSKDERPAFGKQVNEVRQELQEAWSNQSSQMEQQELSVKLAKEELDLTLPGPPEFVGAEHLIPQVINEVVDILARVGFAVRQGPLIESQQNNFSSLNIPEGHPSRDMQDTFYINDEYVLRTHTSPVQVRTMLTEKPPIRILAPGGVFRCDYDATHLPHFHQVEALLVDKDVSMSDLKGTISFFIKEFFGEEIQTRFRPSFFPFTEPSAEVDCTCPVCKGDGCRLCKQTGWIEIGGSGLVHPNVFQAVGIDSTEWQGFAFGFGVERMAMIKYAVNDIRLFNENDSRFLRQFR